MVLQERLEGLSHAALLDDRTFVASNATQARRVFLNWCWWSKAFGLEEDHAELKIVSRMSSQRSELLQVQACFRKFTFVHKLGAPDLRKILYGHRADLTFMAGFSACCALRRAVTKGMMAWEHRPSRGTALGRVLCVDGLILLAGEKLNLGSGLMMLFGMVCTGRN
eukprot:s2439_g8.t1